MQTQEGKVRVRS